MRYNSKKTLFVLLLNVFLVALALYIFDFLNILTLGDIATGLGLKKSEIPKIEDPLLLQREELKKSWERLELVEREQGKKGEDLKKSEQTLKDWEAKLKSVERDQKAREKTLAQTQIEKTKRAERIKVIADQLINMPPAKSVERIEAIEDDLLIIEILQAIDAIFADQGKKSTVPYLLSLMKKERAAAIQRKMANVKELKDLDF